MVQDQASESSEEDDRQPFLAVMASIQLDRLPAYASTIRRTHQHGHQSTEVYATEAGPPIFGSYHVLYPIVFRDRTRWLLKVPADGTRDKFGQSNASALHSEALTMLLLKRETSIPLPEVFAFSDTCDNELNCPFILIEYVEGKPLYDVWFDKDSPKDIVQCRRNRSLQDIAAAMVQLDKFTFDKAGSLVFNDQQTPIDVGPMRFVNTPAMLDRLQCEDPDESTIYLEAGPFSAPKEYYSVILSYRGEQSSSFERGLLSFLRLAISCIPEPAPTNKSQKPFVLAHPDMDIQNFLVDDEGALQAIIDWDGVGCVPHTLGNRRYPSFLTRDWDPAMYGWNEDMERGIEPVGVWEDSPETLRFYRGVYAGFIASGAEAHSMTRNSVVYENLHIAASEPLCTHSILEKMFDEIVRILRDAGTLAENEHGRSDNTDESKLEEFDIFNVCWALDENRLSENDCNILKSGFAKLLQGNEIL